MPKTINDVTRDELAALAEASLDALRALRGLMFIIGPRADEFADEEDRLYRALVGVGIPAMPRSEFTARLQAVVDKRAPNITVKVGD